MRYFQGSLSILKFVQQELLIAPAVWCPYQPSIYILLITSKFRLHALASFMLFLLCSYLHLCIMEDGNSKTPPPGEVYLVVWWGHHCKYNPLLIQLTVNTVFTPILLAFIRRATY